MILIVEDDLDARECMSEVLTARGYPVISVSNGARALQAIDEHGHPRLIVLDLMMPVMDGWQLSLRLQSDRTLSEVPVIVLSGLAERNVKIAANAIVSKPIVWDEFFVILNEHYRV